MKLGTLITIGTLSAFFLFRRKPFSTGNAKTDEKIASLHPALRAEIARIVNTLAKKGISIQIISGYRSIAKQNSLYAQGRTKPGNIVTNAKGGQSYHNYGLAVDISYKAKDLPKIVQAFKRKGYEWGGDWTSLVDKPHFQKTFGYTTKQLFLMPKRGDYPIFLLKKLK